MKKFLTYIIVLLIGAGVFFLQFASNKKYQPNEYYQVYLDNEKIGVIKSKEELEKYISSQGAVVKEQVEEYSIDVDKTLDEIFELCDSLNISYEDENTFLTDDDITLLDNEIANGSLDEETEDIEDELENDSLYSEYDEELDEKVDKIISDEKIDN